MRIEMSDEPWTEAWVLSHTQSWTQKMETELIGVCSLREHRREGLCVLLYQQTWCHVEIPYPPFKATVQKFGLSLHSGAPYSSVVVLHCGKHNWTELWLYCKASEGGLGRLFKYFGKINNHTHKQDSTSYYKLITYSKLLNSKFYFTWDFKQFMKQNSCIST